MAATKDTGKTYRLFKLAAELNIGRETIVEFLNTKGFEVPNKATTKLDQEMYDLVMNKFEKEHRQIEKQRRKVDAYHERRVKTRKPEEKEKELETEEARVTPQEIPSTPQEKKQPKPETELAPESEVVEEAPTPIVEEIPEPEVVEAQAEHHQTAEVEEVPEQVEVEQEVEAVSVESSAPPEPESHEVIATEETPVPETVESDPPTESIVVETSTPAPTRAEEVVAESLEEEDDEEEEFEDDEFEEEEEEEVKSKEDVIKKPKLKGLSVVGKIDISKSEAEEKGAKKKKKKRKRIRESKSVDINAESKSGTAKSTTGTGTSGTAAKSGSAGKTTERTDKRKRKRKGVSVSQEDVQKAIRETFSRMDDRTGSSRQKRSRQKREEHREQREQEMMEQMENQNILHVAEYATVAELAGLMNVDVSEVIAKCIGLGLMVSINQRLDKDALHLVADEFNYTVEFQEEYAEDVLADEVDSEESLKPRAPIVTIMGHVDHGKTSLLDYIRRANVVAGEAGGITQHIGAYSVELDDGRHITFLDTPGHEAFTAMRARGAQVTDIVVLIVAADDSVMPQTLEAISHAQAAGVPMIVAINKIDKPDSSPERIKQQLADRNVLVEEWGGKVQAVEISAKQGTNVDKLLESILLEAELLDLKANPDRLARGTIIEAEIDKGRGAVATVLVQKGVLNIGDPYIAGQYSGRVRAMIDERGHRVVKAGPSTPVQIIGLEGVPDPGDELVAVSTEQEAKEIATKRQQLRREQSFKQARRRFTLDDISKQIAQGQVRELPLIIKGDVTGSVEALADKLLELSTPEVGVVIVLKGVGEITESDVDLALSSNAIIIGFHVRPNLKARKRAEAEGIDIRTYRIIYETVAEIRAALEGMLQPEEREEVTATIEIRETFKISRLGTIAGCYVTDGKINRNDKVRLLRDGFEVYDGTISSLKRLKEDVREVEQGFECGIGLENMNDIKVGDVIEAYRTIEIKRKLESQPMPTAEA
ncbi:MAG: translation initiation factor IF-2 [Ignavibacteriae bacterium]|nr:translation initiation factor IF-2 [Ignavibacteriota bacterium]MCB9214526.1 translation initiation factor IF-2 [Ignavibacteria bacterium]